MGNVNEVSILISFSAGLLTFLSPCILPLLPSYITYITGKSFEDLKGSGASAKNIRSLTAKHSLSFILGFSVVFVLLGMTITYLGSFFGIKRIWLERIGGGVIILLGLHLLGILKLDFLAKEKRAGISKRKIGYLSSFLMGNAFALGWTPCVGPILSSILIYASSVKSMPRAALLLFIYSLGIGVPFFIASLLINQFLFFFNKFKKFIVIIPKITGAFLLIIGILLISGRLADIASFLY
ncbi:MAG: cytochrome c biogenesis protein CcdA [Candidatus Omnitrophota bacterium]